uniref:NADH-ubiquinone oxidoreductase chain 2 n=1 Tax=Proterorhinus semilunaris TaxID=322563 RepID=A0A8E8U342_9GOBI|nr:NADH dehydrogenase subunit 2 [Proterorhinus semilunaris]QWE36514.1 NADH dehydrogenase subunit 2 [Proterorhinus semilunaris]QWE37267.1 NADH dehydrogenase subunit 2 [Proterorhinus semilunaris]QWE37319.1 NADH dehydrogenase subunit 2 [Proterorhinus semilunaris]
MNPYVISLFLFTLGMGTMLTFSSSHWLLAWMGLEINTLAIIPIMSTLHHPRAVEATTKYFLVQATAAATLLFASTTNAWMTGQWDVSSTTHPFPMLMIVMALSLKLGVAPLHTWLPEVLQGLDLITGLILSTWQKLAPFILLLQLPLQNQMILTYLALVSILVGGWGGLNQTQLRKILAYSSIAHLGWMMLIIQFSPALTILALLMYLLITTAAFLTLHMANVFSLNALASSWTKAPLISALFPLVLLSLAGLPPLSGFLPKWMILQELTKQGLPLTATIAAMGALLSLYFYLRVSYATAFTFSPAPTPQTINWRTLPNKAPFPLPIFMLLSILLLPLAPSMTTLI